MSRLKKRLWPPTTIQTTGAGRRPLVGREKAMLSPKTEGLIYQEIALVRFLLAVQTVVQRQRSNGCNLEKAHRPGISEIARRSSARWCLGHGKREATTGVSSPASGLGVIFCLPASRRFYRQVLPQLGTKVNLFPLAFHHV